MSSVVLALWLLAAPSPEALVRDLGAGEHATREQATAALRQLGAAARAALEQVENSPDPEVRERARALLADIRLGINPDWPADLAERARQYRQLDATERQNTLRRMAKELEHGAVPFLLARLEVGDPNERAVARNALAEIANSRIKLLRAVLRRKDYPAALALARNHAALTAFDSRLLHLEAEAQAGNGNADAAQDCRQRALAAAPDDEAPHYQAAELLRELGRESWAIAEWNQILKIPPADEVYDSNAYLRLADAKVHAGQFAEAAAMLEKALNISQRHGYGLTGGGAKTLEKQIRELRRKAKGDDVLPVTLAKTADGYTLRLQPNALPGDWTDLTLEINDKPHTVAAAKQGLAFPALPKKLTLVIRGTDPDGQPHTITLTGSTDDLEPAAE